MAVGERVRMLTWMFGLALLKSFTALVLAAPSEPSPWVANSMFTLPVLAEPPQADATTMAPAIARAAGHPPR